MTEALSNLQRSLQQLLGLHRELIDLVRREKEALVSADIPSIQELTFQKEVLINSIKVAERDRAKHAALAAHVLKIPTKGVTLSEIIIAIQNEQPEAAQTLQSSKNALTILVKKVSTLNDEIRRLVEKSIEHVAEMKKNVLGEAAAGTETYTQKGNQNRKTPEGARLFSKEA